VAEFAIDELGAYLALPTLTAKALLGDVLDLQHRHPLLWARVLDAATCDEPDRVATAAGCPQGWQATWVAGRCRAAGLSLEAAQWVDAQCAHQVASMAWTPFQDRVAELTLRADPALAEEKRRAREAERQVVVSRTNADGMKRLVIQGHAGEVIVSRGRIHQMALILQSRRTPDDPAVLIAQLEADAATLLLSDPGEALRLLLCAATQDADLAEDIRELAVLDELQALADAREPGRLEGGPASEDWTDPHDNPFLQHLAGPEVDLATHDLLETEPPLPDTAPALDADALDEPEPAPGRTTRRRLRGELRPRTAGPTARTTAGLARPATRRRPGQASARRNALPALHPRRPAP